MTKWYMLSGNENDVAVSSKVSLARNLRDHVFTNRLSTEEKDKIADEVSAVIFEELPEKFVLTHMNPDDPR